MDTTKLAEEMFSDFVKRTRNNDALLRIIEKINSGRASQKDVLKYSSEIGEDALKTIKKFINITNLENGYLDYETAMNTIYPILESAHHMVGDAYQATQEMLDQIGKIHLNPSIAPINEEKIKDLMLKISQVHETDIDEYERLINGTIPNAVESFYDDDLSINAEERAQLGLKTYIVRESAYCCPWCAELEGRYEYGTEPKDIFRRHQNCTCMVFYETEKGYTDVWSKKMYSSRKEAREERIREAISKATF